MVAAGRLGRMDFAITPEQELVRDSLREFATRELRPKYAHWDRTGEFPAAIWRKMGAIGLL
jgi:cyclohexanecarboxyl-CoA dehydrogenase